MTNKNKTTKTLKATAIPEINKNNQKLSSKQSSELNSSSNNALDMSSDTAKISTSDEEMLKELRKAFGTNSERVLSNLLLCVNNIYGDKHTNETLIFVAEFIKELKPKDALETMLISQMLAVHNMTMRSFYRADLPDQTSYGVEVNIDRATKFSRTYLAQMEALKKYRSKSDQKITVEHINVNDGGKAIIGSTINNQVNNNSD